MKGNTTSRLAGSQALRGPHLYFQRTGLCNALLCLGLGIASISSQPVFAGSGGAPSASGKTYDIPHTDLGEALSRFAAQAGVSVFFRPEDVKGKVAGLKGEFTVQSGLQQLLAENNLEAVSDANGYRVKKRLQPPDQPAVLPAI